MLLVSGVALGQIPECGEQACIDARDDAQTDADTAGDAKGGYESMVQEMVELIYCINGANGVRDLCITAGANSAEIAAGDYYMNLGAAHGLDAEAHYTSATADPNGSWTLGESRWEAGEADHAAADYAKYEASPPSYTTAFAKYFSAKNLFISCQANYQAAATEFNAGLADWQLAEADFEDGATYFYDLLGQLTEGEEEE